MKYFYNFLKILKTYINSGVIMFLFRSSYTSIESRLYSMLKQTCKRLPKYSRSSITKFESLYFILLKQIIHILSHTCLFSWPVFLNVVGILS